jgi:hypothetical protein
VASKHNYMKLFDCSLSCCRSRAVPDQLRSDSRRGVFCPPRKP